MRYSIAHHDLGCPADLTKIFGHRCDGACTGLVAPINVCGLPGWLRRPLVQTRDPRGLRSIYALPTLFGLGPTYFAIR